jgi:hypothetical protein
VLIISLIVSSLLMLATNWFVFRARQPVTKTILLCLAVTFGPIFMMFALPAVAFQGLLLVISVVVWGGSRRGPRFFLKLSGAATLKDRRHVAGFLSHRFSQVPDPNDSRKMQIPGPESTKICELKDRWKVQTLDLVGLLMHGDPVAYVSDHLPSMDELRDAPVRPLDKFETLGLIALRQGEELFISRDGASLRMLGGISSTKQCIGCHGGERGDLLGAFSYALERDGR